MDDCLYEDFIVFLHLAGFSTRLHSINECYVFSAGDTGGTSGNFVWVYKYRGNFKVQHDEILLAKTVRSGYIRLDLSNPKLYHEVLRFFGKEEWEIDLFFQNRRSNQDFLSNAKLPENSVEASG